MKHRIHRLLSVTLLGTLFISLSAQGATDILSSPKVSASLRPLTAAPQPTITDAVPAVQALTALAASLSGEEKAEVEKLVGQIKAPFMIESGLDQMFKHIITLEAKLTAAKAKHEYNLNNPPTTIARGVREIDHGAWSLMKHASQKAIADAETHLKQTREKIAAYVGQLALVNSDIAAHLHAKRINVVLALASCLYAVESRNGLQPTYPPAVSRVWVALCKLTPDRLVLAQSRARKELVGWVAQNLGAQAVTNAGLDGMAAASDREDWFVQLVASSNVALTGLKLERFTEREIERCLEIIFFEPVPTDSAPQVLQALQKLMTGSEPGQSLSRRFSKESIKGALESVSPGLGSSKLHVDGLAETLSPLTAQS